MNPEFFLKQIQITKDYLIKNHSKTDFTGKGLSSIIQINKDLKKIKMSQIEKDIIYKELADLKTFIIDSIGKFE